MVIFKTIYSVNMKLTIGNPCNKAGAENLQISKCSDFQSSQCLLQQCEGPPSLKLLSANKGAT